MKIKFFFSIILLLLLTHTYAQSKISFNGYYYHASADSINPYKYFLRFYPDGTVITVTTAGKPENLKKWFTKDYKDVAKGKYVLKDNIISFSINSTTGTVEYTGTIDSQNRLQLHVTSKINAYDEQEEYLFMIIDDLK
jgi:hypothetical protein